MSAEKEVILKILIIGDSGTGKSSILCRFAEKKFEADYIATIGVDFKCRKITIDDTNVKLQMWDTAGQERFRTIASTYYRGAHGVIIVFDLTSHQSFVNISKWFEEIKERSERDAVPILVGNKLDMPGRAVTTEEAEKKAASFQMDYFEVSAKDGSNIENAFHRVGELALQRKRSTQPENQKPITNINVQANASPKSKKCC
ncbi:hypothetical protein MXB_5648 [Myxobolus squamalis]|nr:hypothetical protein MXB_5648 [Myxobolus squamalis]